MDEVAKTGRETVITKRGRPVARLVPVRHRRGAPFGRDRDIIKIHGDIGAPIDVEWDAETGKNWVEPLVLSRGHRSQSVPSRRPDRRGDSRPGDSCVVRALPRASVEYAELRAGLGLGGSGCGALTLTAAVQRRWSTGSQGV